MKVYKHPNYYSTKNGEKTYFVDVVEVERSEVALVDFAICKQPREKMSEFYNRQAVKPTVLVNGGLFNMSNGETIFSAIDEGVVQSTHAYVHDGFAILKDKTTEFVFGNINKLDKIKDFVSGYPVLLDGDGIFKTHFPYATEINYNATRSLLGYNDTKIFVVTVGKPGLNFSKCSQLMLNLGCKYAINLDGGGSSRLMVNGEVVNNPTENRSIDSVVAIYIKSDETTEDDTIENEPYYIEYTVVYGDSLWSISTKFLGKGARYKEIVELNKLGSNTLRVGQKLKIPVDYYEYTVVYGDSLWKIATKELGSGARYKEIVEFNNLSSTVINVGQVLKIPV